MNPNRVSGTAAAAYLAIFCMVVGIAGVIGAAVWIAVTQSR